MEAARIWITGAGVVSALGRDAASTWDRLLLGERGIGPLELFDGSSQKASVVGAVRGEVVPERGPGWSRTSAFADRAGREALVEAGLDPRGARVGLVVGSTTGGMFETEALLAKLHAEPHTHEGRRALLDMLSHPLTSTADCLAGSLGPFARTRTVCSACSSGANALVVGALWLLGGELDAVLAGGSDGLCRLTLSGFNALGAIDPEPCRPFDRRRRGLNLGEGAGFVVLERASHARARGKEPLAELAGWALRAEAHHITNPEAHGETAAAAISGAIARAGLVPADIDYVNAHGTATPLNDPMEAAALATALGAEVERIPVSSSKGQLGHTLGAAGAIEAVVVALAVQRGGVPPTAGLEEPDPACPLSHVMGKGRACRVRAALSSSFGFGGMDTVLLVTEPELGPAQAPRRRAVVVTGAATLTPAGLGGSTETAALVSGAPRAVASGRLGVDLGAHLDVARARRMDRPARLGAIVAARALAEAGGEAFDVARAGVLLGSAFGSVDPSAAFMHRVFERGPRFASPAEFPNLVPSSPVGHVSIYLGLRGPALGVADLATSGECAFAEAVELVAAGEADVLVTGAVEEASDIAQRVLAGLFARSPEEEDAPRGEGAAALVLEDRDRARARGARALAAVERVLSWTGEAPDPLASLRPPTRAATARVILASEGGGGGAILDASAWRDVARLFVAPSAGRHEGLGGVGLAAAAGLLRGGTTGEVLVLGLAKGRGYALILASP